MEVLLAKIIGIAGSLRAGSFNAALLRAAVELAPAGTTIEVASIKGIPLYDGDLEAAQGLPPAVVELKEKIAISDGLLIATPEYNNSMPGVLKNAIDWLSRPASDIPKVFGNRPVAILGASPGGFGTILSQNAWLPVIRTLRMRPWNGPPMLVSGAGKVFDAGGTLTDADVRKRLQEFIAGFAAFVPAQKK
jgi:chromate reductase, NAD(P)H dehydrogenase (quinone)